MKFKKLVVLPVLTAAMVFPMVTPASADYTPTVEASIKVSKTQFDVGTFDNNLTMSVTVTGCERDATMWIYTAGAWHEQRTEWFSSSGSNDCYSRTNAVNLTDLLDDSSALKVGQYKFKFTTPAEEAYYGNGQDEYVHFTAATSPIITVNYTKRTTSFKNWPTSGTVAKYKAPAPVHPIVFWPEYNSTIYLEKKKGNGWVSVDDYSFDTTAEYDASTSPRVEFPYLSSTTTFRLRVKGTDRVTGGVSNSYTVYVKRGTIK